MLVLFWMQCKRKNLIYSFADSSVIGDKHLLANSGDVCILLKPNECQKFLRQLCFSMHKYAFPSNFFFLLLLPPNVNIDTYSITR